MTGNHHRPSSQQSYDPATEPERDQTSGATVASEAVELVPITVWCVDHRGGDPHATSPGDGFEARLAQRLVLTYTRQGETVVDLDADVHLRQAAATASRVYLAITDRAALAELGNAAYPVGLIIARWPRPATGSSAASATNLLTACRLVMTAETCTIAAVRSAEPGQHGTAFAQHLAELKPAAQAAGLAQVLQIVAVGGAGGGDRFLYYATHADADAARTHDHRSPDGPPSHMDLLVFMTRQCRHD